MALSRSENRLPLNSMISTRALRCLSHWRAALYPRVHFQIRTKNLQSTWLLSPQAHLSKGDILLGKCLRLASDGSAEYLCYWSISRTWHDYNDDPQIELELHLMHPYIIVNHDVLLDLFLFPNISLIRGYHQNWLVKFHAISISLVLSVLSRYVTIAKAIWAVFKPFQTHLWSLEKLVG